MAKQYDHIDEKHRSFIENQMMFFVGTSPNEGKINISPKGMDSMRVLDEHTVIWLNLTGSGNETAAHVQENSRMTLMFCSFEGSPLILRVYGKAEEIGPHDSSWEELFSNFPAIPGARQIFRLRVELVQTSCGFGVPLYQYEGPRETLITWAEKKGQKGLNEYQKEKNSLSIDGKEIKLN